MYSTIFMFAPPNTGINQVPTYPFFLLILTIVGIYVLNIFTSKKGHSIIMGVIELIFAFMLYNWTNAHSPYSIGYYNVTWVLKAPIYYIYLLLIVLYTLHGGINIFKSLNKKAE